MYYCEKCGKIKRDDMSKMCFVCGDTTIKSDTSAEEFNSMTEDQKDAWEYHLIENVIKPSRKFSKKHYKAFSARGEWCYDTKYRENLKPELVQEFKPKCPTCGSENVNKISSANKFTSIVAFGLFAIGKINKHFKCNNCGYKW